MGRLGSLSLTAASVRQEATLAGAVLAWADAWVASMAQAAASVRPEAKLAGSVSAWAEVLDCLQTAEGEEAWRVPSVEWRR